MGIRPATPGERPRAPATLITPFTSLHLATGTIVVFAATVLLIFVTVSTPLIKSIHFLKATIDTQVGNTNVRGEITLGCFGYCVGDTCTSAKLGYSLDIAGLLDLGDGRLGDLSNSVLKWITYVLILHPIAAGFGLISVLFGILAHTRGFAGTALSTCFASFAAAIALLAFVFDIAAFVIAKNRISSSDVGGSAELGNAIWMTLAALILYATAGIFFGCGACIIRKQRTQREASEAYKPAPDAEYGLKMRAEAVNAQQRDYLQEGTLPNFPEHDRENIPLTAHNALEYDEPYNQHGGGRYEPRQFASQSDIANMSGNTGAPSLISGVGEGYGRRNPSAPGLPVSLTVDSGLTAPQGPISPGGYSPGGVGAAAPYAAGAAAGAAAAGVGSRLAAEARANRGLATQDDERRLNNATTEPFTGMYGHEEPVQVVRSQDSHYQQQQPVQAQQQHFSPSYAGQYPPYPNTTSPPPGASGPSSHGHGAAGGYGAAVPAVVAAAAGYQHTSPTREKPPVLPYRPPTSPPAQQQQQYYVQNPSTYPDPYANSHETGSLAPTYYTHDRYGGGGGAQQQYPQQTGGSTDMYGAPRY
ncbi:SUR7/PalI family protein [Rhodotorula paludigena]|uniref:SUR7/PalI family protein n=1 Tax=Rhodotorula paludigena TaxID=86838 RepID=UPI00317653B2